MYTIKSKIEDVKESTVKIDKRTNAVFINNPNRFTIMGREDIHKILLKIESPIVTLILDGFTWVSSKKTGLTHVFDENGNYKIVNYIATVNHGIGNFVTKSSIIAFTYFNGDFSKRFISKINRNTFKLENQFDDNLGLNGILSVYDENCFISRNQEKFGLFTFENESVWEINVDDLIPTKYGLELGTPSIMKVAGKLFVEYGKTFRLNPDNGNVDGSYDVKLTNSENEFLYGFQFENMEVTRLSILNAETNELKPIDIYDEFKKHDIQPSWKITVKNNMINFYQNMGSHEAKIGIFDPKQEKIIWKHIFERESGMVGTIKVSKDRIFALTQDKTLHIFEKE